MENAYGLPISEIRELILLAAEHGLSELELKRGQESVRIKRGIPDREVLPPVQSSEYVVTAPITGLYYEAPRPGDPPFVKVGEPIDVGRVLCIIESGGIMNEIEATTGGTVTAARLAGSGDSVEAGEALFSIQP
jgi:acetyl-CoA carboxylase biotin carboxyl carrier protein